MHVVVLQNYVWITFFLLGNDRCLGLFCVGHNFPWREVHLSDFGHSQFLSSTPKSKEQLKLCTTSLEGSKDFKEINKQKSAIIVTVAVWLV